MKDSLKRIVEGASFTIDAETPFEAVLVKGRAYKRYSHRLKSSQMFEAKDVLIDAVLETFRNSPKINIWRNRIPPEVIQYCYDLVPYRKISFVMPMAEKSGADFMVAIFDDRYVRMSREYGDLYREEIEKVAK